MFFYFVFLMKKKKTNKHSRTRMLKKIHAVRQEWRRIKSGRSKQNRRISLTSFPYPSIYICILFLALCQENEQLKTTIIISRQMKHCTSVSLIRSYLLHFVLALLILSLSLLCPRVILPQICWYKVPIRRILLVFFT